MDHLLSREIKPPHLSSRKVEGQVDSVPHEERGLETEFFWFRIIKSLLNEWVVR
jgi:hypothetical protein